MLFRFDGADVASAAGAVETTACGRDNGKASIRATAMLYVSTVLVLLVAGFMWLWHSETRTWFKRKKHERGTGLPPEDSGRPAQKGQHDASDANTVDTADAGTAPSKSTTRHGTDA